MWDDFYLVYNAYLATKEYMSLYCNDASCSSINLTNKDILQDIEKEERETKEKNQIDMFSYRDSVIRMKLLIQKKNQLYSKQGRETY